LAHCDLETGAVIFHERFQGVEGLKDRYFIVISNRGAVVECFTTTTKTHAETKPKLATEFCEVRAGECCLPKRCFIDLRSIYAFDDIQLDSRLRSKSVKTSGISQPKSCGECERLLRALGVFPRQTKNVYLLR
jgi:hypothetical protein